MHGMGSMYDDVDRLRDDADDADDEATRSEPTPARCGVTVLAKTKQITTYPTVAARFYACESQELTGTETEGGGGTISSLGDTFYALNVGSSIPPVTTYVLCTFVGYRWCFRYD